MTAGCVFIRIPLKPLCKQTLCLTELGTTETVLMLPMPADFNRRPSVCIFCGLLRIEQKGCPLTCSCKMPSPGSPDKAAGHTLLKNYAVRIFYFFFSFFFLSR